MREQTGPGEVWMILQANISRRHQQIKAHHPKQSCEVSRGWLGTRTLLNVPDQKSVCQARHGAVRMHSSLLQGCKHHTGTFADSLNTGTTTVLSSFCSFLQGLILLHRNPSWIHNSFHNLATNSPKHLLCPVSLQFISILTCVHICRTKK